MAANFYIVFRGTFCLRDQNYFAYPIEILQFNELCKEKDLNVTKLRSVNNCTMTLMDNGEVYGWGDNRNAVLANNHLRQLVYDTGYYKPTSIYKSYPGNVVDFDLSTNVFVMLTDQGEAYWAGFDEVMAPVKLKTPGNVKVVSVGATEDGLGLVCENGETYGWNTFYSGNQKAHNLN